MTLQLRDGNHKVPNNFFFGESILNNPDLNTGYPPHSDYLYTFETHFHLTHLFATARSTMGHGAGGERSLACVVT
jgi:hypothetical protein